MVGSAIVRRLQQGGYTRLITRSRQELDLLDQPAVFDFLKAEKPDYIFLAAAKVGGIYANNTYRADFIYENLTIQNNIVHGALKSGVEAVEKVFAAVVALRVRALLNDNAPNGEQENGALQAGRPQSPFSADCS